jgi:hypothetical protein
MFNFKTLKLCHPEEDGSLSSFVGIRRNKKGELEFRLPRGFSEFPVDDFDQTKRLFFRLYSTFKKFERDSTRDILDQRPAGKDNAEKQGNGYRFKDKEDNDVILYSKIALIENLLDVYRDLALDVMERRIGRDEKIDFSKIEHYLHRAVYLPNHVIFIDEMDLPRQTLQYEATTLIDLFCFILSELQVELEQEIDTRVQELAHRFSEQHLNHDQSLFNEETFEITIQTLKYALDDVDKHTAYKDDDYWRLYEAIELFLYGELDMEEPHEDGTYWGINNFSSVWEDMCNTYAFANFDVVYADTNIVFNGERVANFTFGGHKIFKKNNFENPFFIRFRNEKRWMRPDLINFIENKDSIFNDDIKIKILKKYPDGKVDIRIILNNENKVDLYMEFVKIIKTIKNTPNIESLAGKAFQVMSSPNEFGKTVEVKRFSNEMLNHFKNEINKRNINKFFLVFDWKYMDKNFFEQKSNKLDTDITKQICYESCLNSVVEKIKISSEFVIPCYFIENREKVGLVEEDFALYPRLRENGIKIFKADFQLIQDVYLNHD